MLEEAADHALDADMLAEPRHARAQAADAAHHEVDLHAGAGGRIEPVDQLRVDQRIELGPDRSRLASLRLGDLRVDQAIERGPIASPAQRPSFSIFSGRA